MLGNGCSINDNKDNLHNYLYQIVLCCWDNILERGDLYIVHGFSGFGLLLSDTKDILDCSTHDNKERGRHK